MLEVWLKVAVQLIVDILYLIAMFSMGNLQLN